MAQVSERQAGLARDWLVGLYGPGRAARLSRCIRRRKNIDTKCF